MKNILGKDEDLELCAKARKIVLRLNSSVYSYEETYDSFGNPLTFKDSDGYSSKYTRDSDGNELTFEDSKGERRGFDVPEYTMKELVEKIGNFKIINK